VPAKLYIDEIISSNTNTSISMKNTVLDGFKLKSSENSITKSDGTTSVLSESGGAVTLTADAAVVEGNIRSSGTIGVTQADGDYLAKLYQSSADGFLELFTGEAAPVSRTKITSYGNSYINPNLGNVGIGTSSPNAKLDVNGTVKGTLFEGNGSSITNIFHKFTTPTTWSATFTGQNDVTISVSSQFGVPSTAKAILVTGYYHISGYGQGAAGQGDHALSMFKENNSWSGASPWSFTTSSDTGWGCYVLEHDGDASGSPHHYGAWGYNGIIPINANGNIYGRLGWGLSGGTHYNTLWCFGYWL